MTAKSNPIGSIDPALAKLGFSRINPVQPKRLSMEVSGKTKGGKTHLMFTMTPPIGILNTDRSLQSILPLFPDVDVIVRDFSDRFEPGEQLEQKQAKALEADFARAYRALYEHKHIRSIGVSKWNTIWEVARFAEFGVASMKAHHYVPVNLRMRGYLSMYQQYGKNLLLEQDVKDEWVGDKPTGRLIVDGFKYTPGLVEINASMRRDEDKDRNFVMRIDGCAQNAELVGWEFFNDEIDFKEIALRARPDTLPKDWR